MKAAPGFAAALVAGVFLAARGVGATVTAARQSARSLPHPVRTAANVSPATIGRASWYGNESGRRTASGELFHQDGTPWTCASPGYRAGGPTYWIRVTNLANGKSETCKVNDRGPAGWTHRILDVSHGMAVALGMIHAGQTTVRIEQIAG
jgi:rare lipoprotein A